MNIEAKANMAIEGRSACPASETASFVSSPGLGSITPVRHLRTLAISSLLIALASLGFALEVPTVGLSATRVAGGVRLIGPDVTIPAGARLAFSLPDGKRIALPAIAIADDAAPLAGEPDRPLHWRRVAELAQMLGTGRAALHYATADGTAQTFVVRAAPRGLLDVPLRHWSAWLTAIIALVLGQWVWIVRRHDWPSRQFALMSLGLFLAAIPTAAGGDEPLAALHYRWLLALNGTGTMLFGAGLLGMLMRFPRPLLPRWLAATILVACLCVSGAQAFELVDESSRLIALACALIFAAMVGLLTAQVVAARRNRKARSAAWIIASTTGVAMTIVFAITILPIILRIGQPVPTAFVFPIILIVHAGVALAVTRAKLLSVNDWMRAATRRAASDAVVVTLDLALVVVAWTVGGLRAILVAVPLAAVHVVSRDFLRRRRHTAERARERELLNRITKLSLAADPVRRQALWREALGLAFSPLDIASDPGGDEIGLDRTADGLSLRIPPTVATGALLLSHAENGMRRFDAGDVERAGELLTLLTTTTRARDEYVRGVTEERLRIARDLHDDVGARLMTSLHRRDEGTMRQDIHDAMADIRLIVGSLGGEARPLGDLMADLRHEALARLTSAGLAVRWPVDDAELADPVSAVDARHLTSILRELVSNVIRHSGAATVDVAVTTTLNALNVRFVDDGGRSSTRRPGNGLANLARRAGELGGEIVLLGPPAFAATLRIPRRPSPASPEDGMAGGAIGR